MFPSISAARYRCRVTGCQHVWVRLDSSGEVAEVGRSSIWFRQQVGQEIPSCPEHGVFQRDDLNELKEMLLIEDFTNGHR